MLVPFGTRVVDADGKAVGTVRHVVLHPDTQHVVGLVVHQGVVKSRDLVVPLSKIARPPAHSAHPAGGGYGRLRRLR